MDWLQITVFTSDAGLEPVLGALDSAGVVQVEIDQSSDAVAAFLNQRAVYWDYADADRLGAEIPCVKAYVSDTPQGAQTLSRVKEAVARLRGLDLGLDMGSLSLTVDRVRDEDWANNWKQYYKPLSIGRSLLVVPSWETAENPQGRTVLKMDPGMTFGTGTHATTSLCLELMEQALLPGRAMLDLGCGSGILAIAALLLGADKAFACDIDPIAEKIVRENAALNGVAPTRLKVMTGDALSDQDLILAIGGGYQLVCANIVADVILRLAPFAAQCLLPGGFFIASGVIDERKDEVVERLGQCGLSVERLLEKDGWVAMLTHKPQ